MSDKESKQVVGKTLDVIEEIRKETWRKWRMARYKEIALIAFTAYLAIWLHSAFMSTCISTSYLSNTEAKVCSTVFWPWYHDIKPGPQYSVKHPAPTSHTKYLRSYDVH